MEKKKMYYEQPAIMICQFGEDIIMSSTLVKWDWSDENDDFNDYIFG